jgi:DNA-binding NarL/FixJ family response regulator
MGSQRRIQVMVVDDHAMMRSGLRELIGDESDMEVVAEAIHGRDAQQRLESSAVDVVVMDLGMPILNGIDATRQIRQAHPHTGIIGLSMHRSAPHVLGMLRAGANGYLLKDADFTELATAIRTVDDGRPYLCPEVAGVVAKAFAEGVDASAEGELLSTREREVLQLLAEGRTHKEAARILGISAKTVENHRHSIGRKLGIDSSADLVKYAIRQGLTQLNG